MANGKKPEDNRSTNTQRDMSDIYSDDQTREIVSKLFDEFAGDGETNYFADYTDPFMDEDTDEEESLGESIARRRRRAPDQSKKSIVFRKKSKKQREEEPVEEPVDTLEEEQENTANEPPDLEKTIVLPKLSKFFKKSAYDEDGEDEDIDDFFKDLAKDSVARTRGKSAEKEEKPLEHTVRIPAIREEEPQEEAAATREEKPSLRTGGDAFKGFKSVYAMEDEDTQVDSRDMEDDEEDEGVVEVPLGRILNIAGYLICAVVIATLMYANVRSSTQLEEARSQITELQKNSSSTYETELEQLKQQVAELTAENESLMASSTDTEDPHTAAVQILSEAQSEIASEEQADESLSQGESAGNTYTVKSGDTFWKIAQSVYGNGAEYQKILDANGLTENSVINEGQVLNIPN